MSAAERGRERIPHVGRILRDAAFCDPKRPEEERMAAEALVTAAGRLPELLHEREIDYLLVGGLALLQSVEGRNTADVNLIMALEDLDRLPELRQGGRKDAFIRARLDAQELGRLRHARVIGHDLAELAFQRERRSKLDGIESAFLLTQLM